MKGRYKYRIAISLIFLLWAAQIDSCAAEGYFQLILRDGSIVNGEMIRVTPSTIEFDPDGPETFASYNRSEIKEILYKRGLLSNNSVKKETSDQKINPLKKGLLAFKFNLEHKELLSDSSLNAQNYVMIDSALYFTGQFADFYIELPAGRHIVEFSGPQLAYFEPGRSYSFWGNYKTGKVWRQSEPFFYGEEIRVEIEDGKSTLIVVDSRKGDYLFISAEKSKTLEKEKFQADFSSYYKKVNPENKIVPGRLIFDRLPDNLLADSLEYRYRMVFNDFQLARFNDYAYLPGKYRIETRVAIWNEKRNKIVRRSMSHCPTEIKSGHTTWVTFFGDRMDLHCSVTIMPKLTFEISNR